MSKYLERAREALGGPTRSRDWYSIANLILLHLEAQEAAAPSPTTASPTTEAPSAADSAPPAPPTETGSTTPTTPLLQLLLGILTQAEFSHAVQCSSCRDRLGAFVSSVSTHALVAATHDTPASPTSTSAKPDSSSSVASPQADAPSPTGSSDQVGTLGALGPFALDAKALNPPARPQWPEPKPGEDAWTRDIVRSGLIVPDGKWWTYSTLADYLNALYRGEVGPRDRWPS